MILFINACVRKESRTRRLADHLLDKLGQPFDEVCLHDIAFPVTDEAFLEMRDRLIAEEDFGNPAFDLARQFSEAETLSDTQKKAFLSACARLKGYIMLLPPVDTMFRLTLASDT